MSRFEILTPLDFTVRTSDEHWKKIIAKHPDIAELEISVKQTLSDPDEIRLSSNDPSVLLFYRILKKKRWMVAVTRRLDDEGFRITTYQTDAIKQGDVLWHR